MYKILVDAGSEGFYFSGGGRQGEPFETAEEALEYAQRWTYSPFLIVKVIEFKSAE